MKKSYENPHRILGSVPDIRARCLPVFATWETGQRSWVVAAGDGSRDRIQRTVGAQLSVL